MKLKFNFCLVVIIVLASEVALAQHSNREYKKQSLWIAMIDNPNTNYYEAVKAYQLYWKNHSKPVEKKEMMSEGKNKVQQSERKRGQYLNNSSLKKLAHEQEMVYQCKRFEQWQHEVFPYVQNDGRILTEEERMQIYRQRNSSEK